MIEPKNISFSLSIDNLSHECDISSSLTIKQNENFLTISKVLDSLRQQIVPYPNEYFHDRGIVLTVEIEELKLARSNLRMLLLSNTRLPVQVWYSSTQVSHRVIINLLDEAPKLYSSVCCFDTNQCQTHTQNWQLKATYVYKPHSNKLSKNFPYKLAAIISATFAEVLFLDCDAYVTRDPDDLFLSDPIYIKFGALFYPDAYKSRQHPLIWKISNTSYDQEEYELL